MAATILVVDDDEVARELLYLHLSGAGYRVHLAEDAIVAGHVLLDQRVDLLLTDIEMPFMDGLDLVRAIRNDPAVSTMPVVFVTAHPAHEDQARELNAAYLRKPVQAAMLLGLVARKLKSPLQPCVTGSR
jgi:two-component system chemotaxis response regulator CheY